jgi:hypothetical protein
MEQRSEKTTPNTVNELTGVTSLGRLHLGMKANPIHHTRNLVLHFGQGHSRSPAGVCLVFRGG